MQTQIEETQTGCVTKTTHPLLLSTAQLNQQLWHLIEQHGCLMEAGHELASMDRNDPDLAEIDRKINEVENQITRLETIKTLYH